MAFITKKDYCGLGRTGVTVASGDAQGATGSVATGIDEDGSIIASTYVDGGASPTNDYDLHGAVAFTGQNVIKLGTVNTVDTGKYMLTGANVVLAAGAAPTLSASSVAVESGASTGGTYDVPAFTIPATHRAAMLFNELTLTGTGCKVINANYNITSDSTVERDELGVPYASGISAGRIEATITIQQTAATEPSVEFADGWTQLAPLTQTNGKGAYPTWTVGVVKYLTKTTEEA